MGLVNGMSRGKGHNGSARQIFEIYNYEDTASVMCRRVVYRGTHHLFVQSLDIMKRKLHRRLLKLIDL